MKFSAKEITIIIGMFFLGLVVMYYLMTQTVIQKDKNHWDFQSIDTMKVSRDRAREIKTDPQYAKKVELQIKAIADTGATHVGVGTPYDEEFLPVISLWARTAHQNGLKVWFRGNWSGWEEWFGYPKIDEKTHTEKTRQFILSNPTLFEDGDIFSSCPECENGTEMQLGNALFIAQYRKFLIEDYQTTKAAFQSIGKNVQSNYYSMNLDVAKAVMDPDTTKALDGLVVIDHYVKRPETLAQDVVFIAQKSGGRVVLGEMGAPIPDINGKMTDDEQRKWLQDALVFLSTVNELEGLNYWTNKEGSTALWRDDDTPRPSVEVLTQYFGGRRDEEENTGIKFNLFDYEIHLK